MNGAQLSSYANFLHIKAGHACMRAQVACVSGAQLSNYATFLVHPEQAPLSIVLTALSTACGVFLTPLLALVLLGARIPVDAASMALSIVQIVLVPVLAGSPSPLSSGTSSEKSTVHESPRSKAPHDPHANGDWNSTNADALCMCCL